ncbi:MAG TPA: ATPase domain-containing protein, partial [Pirellulaceae bacterium]|nr:ATPase domain-containing protein [Pirellulaceae bacterium]
MPHSSKAALAKTGISGLDDILGGGFTPHRLYLIEGVPGSGKTTLAVQFLLEGIRQGEPVLYVTLSESTDELRAV